MKIIALFSFVFIFLSSCDSKKPVACFLTPSPPIHSGMPQEFKNCSENALVYTWDFGDGGTNAELSPYHTYTSPGNYLVHLEVGNGKKADDHKRYISVVQADLAKPSEGTYSGSYREFYPDSSALDTSYSGTLKITRISATRIQVSFHYGSFETSVFGNLPDYSFVEIEKVVSTSFINPSSGVGFYKNQYGQFSFSIDGKNKLKNNLLWNIEFNGSKQ